MIYFADIITLSQGLLTGIIFGFLLQKGRASRFDVIVGQFLLKDFTVIKIMVAAILVGGVGVYGMLELGMIAKLPLVASSILGSVVGGAIFGVGMALLGYCPGTGVAALGEGAKDAWFGVLGMVVGAGIFGVMYPYVHEYVFSNKTDATLATWLGVSPWLVWAILIPASIGMFVFLERKKL